MGIMQAYEQMRLAKNEVRVWLLDILTMDDRRYQDIMEALVMWMGSAILFDSMETLQRLGYATLGVYFTSDVSYETDRIVACTAVLKSIIQDLSGERLSHEGVLRLLLMGAILIRPPPRPLGNRGNSTSGPLDGRSALSVKFSDFMKAVHPPGTMPSKVGRCFPDEQGDEQGISYMVGGIRHFVKWDSFRNMYATDESNEEIILISPIGEDVPEAGKIFVVRKIENPNEITRVAYVCWLELPVPDDNVQF